MISCLLLCQIPYYDDQLWSIPFQRSAVVLYYNVDQFAELPVLKRPRDGNPGQMLQKH